MSTWDSFISGAGDLIGLAAEVKLSEDQADMLNAQAQMEALKVQQSLPSPQSQALPDYALTAGFNPSSSTGKLLAVVAVGLSIYFIAGRK